MAFKTFIPKDIFDKWFVTTVKLALSPMECQCCCFFCSELVINECRNKSMRKIECPICKKEFCLKCQIPWHHDKSCYDHGVHGNNVKFAKLLITMTSLDRGHARSHIVLIKYHYFIFCALRQHLFAVRVYQKHEHGGTRIGIIVAPLPNCCRSSKTVAASSTGTAAASSLKIAKSSLYHPTTASVRVAIASSPSSAYRTVHAFSRSATAPLPESQNSSFRLCLNYYCRQLYQNHHCYLLKLQNCRCSHFSQNQCAASAKNASIFVSCQIYLSTSTPRSSGGGGFVMEKK
ncbi:hypothetical protein Ahy_A03g016616 [Arachis hypogaea]|uniref:IBR domain-containing protein n=1 Tax=Arachis hypogaea TaxID=3818 RepID=A0A445E3V0_ARAHY|nr:hypothetical protein Ahy_A03g016616 [Arachis hypogaea]